MAFCRIVPGHGLLSYPLRPMLRRELPGLFPREGHARLDVLGRYPLLAVSWDVGRRVRLFDWLRGRELLDVEGSWQPPFLLPHDAGILLYRQEERPEGLLFHAHSQRLFPLPPAPAYPDADADRVGWVAVGRLEGGVGLYGPDGQVVDLATPDGRPPQTLAWHPRGRSLAVVTVSGIWLWHRGRAQPDHLPLPVPEKASVRLRWSPDGRRLAAVIGGPPHRIYLWTSGEERLTLFLSVERGDLPAFYWGPDCALVHTDAGNLTLYLGEPLRPHFEARIPRDFPPVWSPNRRALVLVHRHQGFWMLRFQEDGRVAQRHVPWRHLFRFAWVGDRFVWLDERDGRLRVLEQDAGRTRPLPGRTRGVRLVPLGGGRLLAYNPLGVMYWFDVPARRLLHYQLWGPHTRLLAPHALGMLAVHGWGVALLRPFF